MSKTFRLKEYGGRGRIRFDTPYIGDYLTETSLSRKEKYCVAFVELFMRVEDLESEIAGLKQRIKEMEAENEKD